MSEKNNTIKRKKINIIISQKMIDRKFNHLLNKKMKQEKEFLVILILLIILMLINLLFQEN